MLSMILLLAPVPALFIVETSQVSLFVLFVFLFFFFFSYTFSWKQMKKSSEAAIKKEPLTWAEVTKETAFQGLEKEFSESVPVKRKKLMEW